MADKKQTQHEIWNTIAPIWKEYRKVPNDEVKEFIRGKSGNILDLGCGSGRNFGAINKESKLYAVDFSEEMIKFSKAKAERLKLNADISVSSATSLPFKDNMFDAAIFAAVLHCIDSIGDRLKALKELFRVLKPGAEALITVWSKNHERIKGKTKDQRIPWSVGDIKLQRYYYIYELDELASLLKEAGFNIVSLTEDSNIIMAIVKKPV
jgi:ubiquinone/menaquinone biosynthesis C-methylase UbiE